MDPKMITPELSVSSQITTSDIDAIAAAGFRSIICNRPDGEAADQPTFEEIEAAARAKGLTARYQPVVSGKVRDEDAKAFAALIAELPKPLASTWAAWCAASPPVAKRRPMSPMPGTTS
jgi:sulfide:quinone oxidoreductase